MKRNAIDSFIKWKTSYSGKPLLLTGAKGVGKTYLTYDFAKAFFAGIYYINFERDPDILPIFQTSRIDEVIQQLMKYFDIHEDYEPEPNKRLLILDEISYCPEQIKQSLHLLQSEQFPFVLAISSLPIPKDIGVNYYKYTLNPMDFDEFLRATSHDWYIETIINHYTNHTPIPDIVHKELLALHQIFLRTGGMPSSINEYIGLFTLINIGEQHNHITSTYIESLSKLYHESEALKMRQVFDSIPLQLMKENRKFQYKLIRKGTTQAMYKDAIHSLVDHNYVLKCEKLNSEDLTGFLNSVDPTEHSHFNSSFKMYCNDVGLLYTKIIEEKGSYIIRNSYKALLENYTAQVLKSKGYALRFWESDSMAKVDFIISRDHELLPIDIYIDDNTRSKSISVLKQKHDFPFAIKISSRNFEFTNNVKYIPYYALFCL